MLKSQLIDFLNKNNCDYLLVNSTNEFLVEYNRKEENARYYLTGFTGSTGEALLCKNGEVYLFVDGRYHEQADREVFDYVNVVKMQLGETLISNLVQKITPNSKLAVISSKISLNFYNNILTALRPLIVDIVPFSIDPVFEIVGKSNEISSNIIDIPLDIVGVSSSAKIKKIQNTLSDNDVRLVCNLEQVAYLLNKRSFGDNFSSSFNAKMLITKDDYRVFYEHELLEYQEFLKSITKNILYSPKSISYSDYLLISDKSTSLSVDDIENLKAVKNDCELAHMQDCFRRTDNVLAKVSTYVNSSDSLTEQELVDFVRDEFFNQGAKSLSFNTILASGKNSALAHYSVNMNNVTQVKSGDFVLLDCGAYFEGGYSTDITRVFCFGEPSDLSKKIYTTVLRAFLNAYNIEICENLSGFDIDKIARDIISASDLDGFNFNHGTGHGVGISVHEFPPSISMSELAKSPLVDGMVFTIEPGMYNPDFGGVRLENTVYFKDGKIKSFSKMKFEEKLIDYNLLSENEKTLLKEWL